MHISHWLHSSNFNISWMLLTSLHSIGALVIISPKNTYEPYFSVIIILFLPINPTPAKYAIYLSGK